LTAITDPLGRVTAGITPVRVLADNDPTKLLVESVPLSEGEVIPVVPSIITAII
jgi:hypothetical protein